MNETYSVYQWFVDGSREDVLVHKPIEEVLECVRGLITSVGAQLGTTKRVIITDWGDCINFEWIYGKGVVYPTPEDIEKVKEEPEFPVYYDAQGNEHQEY